MWKSLSLQSSCSNSQVDRNEIPTEIACLRTKELALLQMRNIRDLPSESGKQARRTEYGLKEDQNLLFTLSVDMFRWTELLMLVMFGTHCHCSLAHQTSKRVEFKWIINTRFTRHQFVQPRVVVLQVSPSGDVAYHSVRTIQVSFEESHAYTQCTPKEGGSGADGCI